MSGSARRARDPRLNPMWEIAAVALAAPLGLGLGWLAPRLTQGDTPRTPRVGYGPVVPPYDTTPGPELPAAAARRRGGHTPTDTGQPPVSDRHRPRPAAAAHRTSPRTAGPAAPRVAPPTPAADPFSTTPAGTPTGVLLPAVPPPAGLPVQLTLGGGAP